jgi:ABC-type uncharacterized transport system substrate-binding protein
VANLNLEAGPKKLQLLHELVPTATIIGLLVNPANPNNEIRSNDMQAAARILGVEVDVLRASIILSAISMKCLQAWSKREWARWSSTPIHCSQAG